jgi:hypothetical protein
MASGLALMSSATGKCAKSLLLQEMQQDSALGTNTVTNAHINVKRATLHLVILQIIVVTVHRNGQARN